MHTEFKTMRSSVSHLAELKAFEKRIAAMEARQDAAMENLSSRLNDTAAAMEVLQGAAVQNLSFRLDQTAAAMEVRQDAAAENLSSRLNHTAARQAAIEARQDAVMANFSSSLNETAAVMETCLAAIENLSSRLNDTVTDFCRTRRMGMSTGDIPDSSFTASSYYDHRFVPANARFGIIRSWIPRTVTAEVEWLKIDLGQETLVYGVITQGRPDYSQWTQSYRLSFSMDGETWTTYADTDGSDKVFQGNYDRSSPVYNFLDSPLTTRHVQFHPRTYTSRPAVRMEVLGCPTELL
ncbi:lactadherin-like [Branchiostoma floridae]|uniref:Lactadherin-like n=1 Tax=Branchiostoma floridae TaxID=7739 RepID=A0A9J7MSM2_BRAFL|nr:lactadherin-like [Branchiostoma floridae]